MRKGICATPAICNIFDRRISTLLLGKVRDSTFSRNLHLFEENLKFSNFIFVMWLVMLRLVMWQKIAIITTNRLLLVLLRVSKDDQYVYHVFSLWR